MAAPDPAKVQALAERAQSLGKLKEHPSWAELREVFEAKRERYFNSLAKSLQRSNPDMAPVNQREIDYWSGFFNGAKWILDNPDQAEKSLEIALKKVELSKAEESE